MHSCELLRTDCRWQKVMTLHLGALIACISLQDMDDGAYHEEDEQAEQLRLKVQDIVAVEWATSHSLGLGANDYTPALVMRVIKPTAGDDAINGLLGLLTSPIWGYASFTMLCSDMHQAFTLSTMHQTLSCQPLQRPALSCFSFAAGMLPCLCKLHVSCTERSST